MPFELKVSMVGHFTYQEQEGEDTVVKDHILQENTVSILFPFLRSIVAALTSNANIPTLMLPVMNFTKDI
jgi:preprotein translocase subunit SecB